MADKENLPVGENNDLSAANILMRIAVAFFVFWALFAILSYRCLYADGSHDFVRVLQDRNFIPLMWSRQFSVHLFQLPMVLAIKLGVVDLRWLRYAFGLGCFLPWVVTLAVCRWLSPKNFWLVVVGCAAGYLNAAYMAMGEHIMAHALFWPALYVVLFARPLKPMAAIVLLATATGLLFSYESQLFLSSTLAALTVRRLFEEDRQARSTSKSGAFPKLVFLAAIILFLISVGVALYSLRYPELPGQYEGFLSRLERVVSHAGWTLTWTAVWAGLTLAACWSDKFWELLRRPILMIPGVLALALWGLWPCLAPDALDTAVQYENRILDLLVPLALVPVALTLHYRPQWIQFKISRLVCMAAALLLAQSLWQICATIRWQADTAKLKTILSERNGVVPLHKSPLDKTSIQGHEYIFDWTWPCLSIALAPDPNIHSLVVSEWFLNPDYKNIGYWEPFSPIEADQLPDLSYFGINFTNYVFYFRQQQGQPAR